MRFSARRGVGLPTLDDAVVYAARERVKVCHTLPIRETRFDTM